MNNNNIEHMDKKIVLRNFFVILLLGFVVLSVFLISKEKECYQEEKVINIEKNLRISFNEEEEEITNLEEYKLPQIKKGDKVSVSYMIPRISIDNPCLIIESYHSLINVYINDDLIYKYGEQLYREDKNIGHEYLHIPMLSKYEGKTLRIEYTYTKDNSVSCLDRMQICNGGNSYLKIINDNVFQLLLMSTTFLIGVIGLLFSICRRKYTLEHLKMSYISIFSIIAAVCVLCSSKLVFLIFRNPTVVNMLEYYSLYSASIPLILYFSALNYSKLRARILNILALFQFTTIFMTLFNYYVFKINYADFLTVFHIILLLEFVVILTLCKNMPKKRSGEKVVIIGLIIMAVFGVLDIIKFNLNKYMLFDLLGNTNLLTIGVAIFVLREVYIFYIGRIENIVAEKEKKALEKLAFIDILTGINSRTKCEMLFEEYEKKYESIAIGSFDIDNFKYINDNLGHTIGDKAIKDIAVLLKESFGGIGDVGRMGGDEFIVIAPGNNIEELEESSKKFLNSLNEYNKRGEIEVEVSVSYGYGKRLHRSEKNIMKVYEESDKNMYICKRNKKDIQ